MLLRGSSDSRQWYLNPNFILLKVHSKNWPDPRMWAQQRSDICVRRTQRGCGRPAEPCKIPAEPARCSGRQPALGGASQKLCWWKLLLAFWQGGTDCSWKSEIQRMHHLRRRTLLSIHRHGPSWVHKLMVLAGLSPEYAFWVCLSTLPTLR